MRSDMQFLANQIPDSATRRAVQQLVVETLADARFPHYNADAGLLEIDFHYEIDTVGSREMMSK